MSIRETAHRTAVAVGPWSAVVVDRWVAAAVDRWAEQWAVGAADPLAEPWAAVAVDRWAVRWVVVVAVDCAAWAHRWDMRWAALAPQLAGWQSRLERPWGEVGGEWGLAPPLPELASMQCGLRSGCAASAKPWAEAEWATGASAKAGSKSRSGC